MPEYLGNEGNKLLKLIEEPPANTLFILVAEHEALILPTIVSRTQLVKIPPILNEDIEAALVERVKLGPEQARQLAWVSGGQLSRSPAINSTCRRRLAGSFTGLAECHPENRSNRTGKMG